MAPIVSMIRMMSRVGLGVALLGSVAAPTARAQSGEPAIVPRPLSLVRGRGEFRLTPRTVLVAGASDSLVARRFARAIAPATGFNLAVRSTAASISSRIVFRRAAAKDTTLGPEGYRLDVKPGAVTITSSAPAGAFYATQTLRQALPPAIYRDAPIAGTRWAIPAMSVVDRPRFR